MWPVGLPTMGRDCHHFFAERNQTMVIPELESHRCSPEQQQQQHRLSCCLHEVVPNRLLLQQQQDQQQQQCLVRTPHPVGNADDEEKAYLIPPMPAKTNKPISFREEQPQPQQQPLNQSNNVLLVYRLEEMKSNSTLNFGLALLCLCYCAVNMVLMAVNYMNVQMANDDGINGEPVVSDLTYHLTEFWATFGFACVECISLVHTPKSFFKIYNHPLLLKLILFFNIAATLVPAILVTLNLHVFEIASHEIEYVNEMTMAFVEIVMLKSLLRFETSAASLVGQWVVAGLALAVACLQLGVYNLLGRSDDGDMQGEVPAHYFEFAFEILSSLIAFWFCMDNKNVADEEIGSILYGQHRDCTICSAKSTEFEQMYINNNLKGAMTATATTKDGAGRLQLNNVISNGDNYGSMLTKMYSV
jgi:hypothetical protein